MRSRPGRWRHHAVAVDTTKHSGGMPCDCYWLRGAAAIGASVVACSSAASTTTATAQDPARAEQSRPSYDDEVTVVGDRFDVVAFGVSADGTTKFPVSPESPAECTAECSNGGLSQPPSTTHSNGSSRLASARARTWPAKAGGTLSLCLCCGRAHHDEKGSRQLKLQQKSAATGLPWTDLKKTVRPVGGALSIRLS
jgi:hypothetical protein